MKTLEELSAEFGVTQNWLYRAGKRLGTQDYEFAAAYCYYDSCAINVRSSRHEWNIRSAENRLGRKMFSNDLVHAPCPYLKNTEDRRWWLAGYEQTMGGLHPDGSTKLDTYQHWKFAENKVRAKEKYREGTNAYLYILRKDEFKRDF